MACLASIPLRACRLDIHRAEQAQRDLRVRALSGWVVECIEIARCAVHEIGAALGGIQRVRRGCAGWYDPTEMSARHGVGADIGTVIGNIVHQLHARDMDGRVARCRFGR